MVFQEMIKNKEIPSYKKFTHEPEKKRQRRLAKENREAVEAEELKKELGVGSGDEFNVLILFFFHHVPLMPSHFFPEVRTSLEKVIKISLTFSKIKIINQTVL